MSADTVSTVSDAFSAVANCKSMDDVIIPIIRFNAFSSWFNH